MQWGACIFGLLLWTVAWTAVAVRTDSSLQYTVRGMRNVLLAYAGSTYVFALAVAPAGVVAVLSLWIHHAAVWALFAFLTAAQLLYSTGTVRACAGSSRESVAGAYRAFSRMTEVAPPPIALAILLTGLRLVWQAAQPSESRSHSTSPADFWLMSMILTFGLLFWDGLINYTERAHSLSAAWSDEKGEAVRPAPPTFSCTLGIVSHFVSWPFVFLLGVYRWEYPNPLGSAVENLQQRLAFLPAGWPQVIAAVLLWAAPCPFVLVLRRLTRG